MQKGIIKNVNRLTGEPVDAQDLASIFTGIVGNESGVLTVFDELRLEKISDNKVRLHSGVYSLKGHMLYIPKGSHEDFEIESGTLGANRIDLLVAEYVKNGEGDGEDTLHFRIIKGETTSGTPQVPTLTQQDINENGITRQEKLFEIRMNGTGFTIIKVHNRINSIQRESEETYRRIQEIRNIWESIYFGDNKGYIVFPNGLQICWGRNESLHGATRDNPKIVWYPRKFAGMPTLVMSGDRKANDSVDAQVRQHSQLGDPRSDFYASHGGSASAGVYLSYIAIGKKG